MTTVVIFPPRVLLTLIIRCMRFDILFHLWWSSLYPNFLDVIEVYIHTIFNKRIVPLPFVFVIPILLVNLFLSCLFVSHEFITLGTELDGSLFMDSLCFTIVILELLASNENEVLLCAEDVS